ncbi:hypothetical protein BH20CHL6_BH20CHL6_18010 [soil metagenome]
MNGRVAGFWWAEADDGLARIVLEPFLPLERHAATALEVEAERLAAFIAPVEPTLYARYRRTRARRYR